MRSIKLCDGGKNIVDSQDVSLSGKKYLYPVCEKVMEFVFVW